MYVATVPQPDKTSLIVTRPDGGPLLDSRIADEVFKDAAHPVISRLKQSVEEYRIRGDGHLSAARAAYTARINKAVEECRARGEPRPVFIVLGDADAYIRRQNDRVEGRLRDAIAFDHFALDWARPRVVSRCTARHALEVVEGRKSRRLFRMPQWPVSYWTVVVLGRELTVGEMYPAGEPRSCPNPDSAQNASGSGCAVRVDLAFRLHADKPPA
jgi:hypothetical protein